MNVLPSSSLTDSCSKTKQLTGYKFNIALQKFCSDLTDRGVQWISQIQPPLFRITAPECHSTCCCLVLSLSVCMDLYQFPSLLLLLNILFIYLKLSYREREHERDVLSAGSLPQIAQAETRSQELLLGLPCGGRGPATWAGYLLLLC